MSYANYSFLNFVTSLLVAPRDQSPIRPAPSLQVNLFAPRIHYTNHYQPESTRTFCIIFKTMTNDLLSETIILTSCMAGPEKP